MDYPVYEEPVLYLRIMKATGFVTTIINAGTLLLIFFASSKKIGKYRYFLLAYQITSASFEFMLKIAMVELFVPAPVLRMHQTIMPIDVKICVLVALYVICAMTVATSLCIWYRHRQVLPLGHWARIGTFVIVCTKTEHGQGFILSNWLEAHPGHEELRLIPDIWVADVASVLPLLETDALSVLSITSLVVFMKVSILGTIVYVHAFFMLRQAACTMSEKTRRLHRRLLILLIIQMGIPMLTLASPFVGLALVLHQNWPLPQVANHAVALVIGSHGWTSSMAIVLLTDSYRQYLFGIFKTSLPRASVVARPEKPTAIYEEPVLYVKITAITGVLSTLINIGTFYLIISAMPKRMGQYRYFVLNHQAVASGAELYLKVCMVEIFQPAPAMRFHGALQWSRCRLEFIARFVDGFISTISIRIHGCQNTQIG
ncbi:unnamed protein product, partial [Mesorhabditis spiculigera]